MHAKSSQTARGDGGKRGREHDAPPHTPRRAACRSQRHALPSPRAPAPCSAHARRRRRCVTAAATSTASAVLSEERVRAFACEQLRRLSGGDVELFAGTDFCFVGGMFKCLLYPEARPRDLDIWPRSHADEALLVARLSAVATRAVEQSRWNHKLWVGEQLVEVVKKEQHRDMAATLAGCDLALSAIGAHVVSGTVTEVAVHPLARTSVELRQPLLLLPLANTPFLLATAERALRYARELGWPRPTAQLEQLQTVWSSQDAAFRDSGVANYRDTTLDPHLFPEVLALFGIKG